MEAGASLTAEYKKTAEGGSVSVETTGTDKNAGGFVGYMNTGTNLIIAGASVDKVSSKTRNAGGIVGSVIDGRGILLPENRIKTIQAVCW
ncbi:MAG: hypothetical protein PUG00_00535 [Clostridiales bacterium]|nr:hypothetical protein [Clostridiales bacterium]